jgi:hypothetical protein
MFGFELRRRSAHRLRCDPRLRHGNTRTTYQIQVYHPPKGGKDERGAKEGRRGAAFKFPHVLARWKNASERYWVRPPHNTLI